MSPQLPSARDQDPTRLLLRRRWRRADKHENFPERHENKNDLTEDATSSAPVSRKDEVPLRDSAPVANANEHKDLNISSAHTPNAPETGSSLDIYTAHFGLTERPFSLLPDPDFLFWSQAHMQAYTMLEYGILTRAPITMITGEVGAGKTTLLHHLLKSIGNDVRIGLVSNAHGDRGELLRWVLMSLDQPAPADATYVDLFATFQKHLIEEYAQGHRVILIFDEAQNLSAESLEELRMFTNINSNKDELLQLVLVGQPELQEIIRRPEMRQFAQRVASSFHLRAMDMKTVRKYVGHRLEVAGADRNFFSPAATELIYKSTGGVPRLVNQLCDLAMVYAFTRGRKGVVRHTIELVLNDGAFFAASLPREEGGLPL